MWKQKHKATLPHPFGLAAHQVLVNNELGWIVEISKLSFPEAEIFGRLERIAVLVRHRAELIKICIKDLESAIAFDIVGERNKCLTANLLVSEKSVAVVESTTFDIFSHDASIVALLNKGAHGHCLCRSPIDLVSFNSFGSIFNMEALKSLVDFEVSWHLHRLVPDRPQRINVIPSVFWLRTLLTRHYSSPLVSVSSASIKFRIGCIGQRRHISLALLELCLKMSENASNQFVDLVTSDDSVFDQFVGVGLCQRFGGSDLLVHVRLSESWLINLIVPMLSKPNHVDQDILVERLPVINSQSAHANQVFWSRLGVHAVDSDHRNAERSDDVRTVLVAASVLRIGCEANLVVRDDMNGASNFELWEVAQSKTFECRTLSGKGSVTVGLNVKYRSCILIRSVVDLGSGLSHADCILGLQVTRIVYHSQLDLLVVALKSLSAGAELFEVAHCDMRRYVVYPVVQLHWHVVVSSHLVQKISKRIIVQHDQGLEPASVRHGQHSRVDTLVSILSIRLACFGQQSIDCNHQGL